MKTRYFVQVTALEAKRLGAPDHPQVKADGGKADAGAMNIPPDSRCPCGGELTPIGGGWYACNQCPTILWGE